MYLLLLNRIHKKLLLKEFYIWKCKIITMPRLIKTTVREQARKRMTHAHNPEKINKFQSMTEHNINEILHEKGSVNSSDSVSNIFEELKSSLQNKVLRNEGKKGLETEIGRSMDNIHRKNAMSTSGMYINKGNRRNLLKSTPDMISNLALVSSCSALVNRKDKNMLVFSSKK